MLACESGYYNCALNRVLLCRWIGTNQWLSAPACWKGTVVSWIGNYCALILRPAWQKGNNWVSHAQSRSRGLVGYTNCMSFLMITCLLLLHLVCSRNSLLRTACRSLIWYFTLGYVYCWAYYSEEFGTPFARCNKCSVKIKRGKDGNKKTWSSNPLWSLLKTEYVAEHIKALKERDNADQLTKKRKLDEAEKLAVYVNGTPTLEA